MKLYAIINGNTNDTIGWAGSSADAVKRRKEYFEKHRSEIKKKDIMIEPHDVPTKKVDLVDWLESQRCYGGK